MVLHQAVWKHHTVALKRLKSASQMAQHSVIWINMVNQKLTPGAKKHTMFNLQKWLNKAQESAALGTAITIDLNSTSATGDTLLHVAAIWNDLAAIETLVQFGLDLNAKGENGYTPLHESVEQGNYEAAELLLTLGADPFSENDLGLSAIELANIRNDQKARRLLKREDA